MPTPDEELVRRFGDGDESAFEELVGRFGDGLLALGLRLLGNREEALEIRQMAFVTTYRKAGTFEGRARFSTWLHRVALNLCRDRLRERARAAGRTATETPGELESEAPAPEIVAARGERARSVAAAVLALPPDEREVVVLRHYHDLSFPAIAEILGAPVTTVKSRMTRGLERLRPRLAQFSS